MNTVVVRIREYASNTLIQVVLRLYENGIRIHSDGTRLVTNLNSL